MFFSSGLREQWRSFLAVAAICAGLLCGGEASAAQRKALLIGINDYASPEVNDLRGAVNDVEMLRRILITRMGFQPADIRMLTDRQATRTAILDAMDELVTNAAADDIIYFHYSGHGSRHQDLNGDEDDGFDETILSADARMNGVPDILDDEFESLLSRLRSKHALIVFDSCHSGTITRSVSTVQPRSVPPDTRHDLYSNSTTTRAVVEVNQLGHVLMTGAPPEEEALDGPVDNGYYGLFSYSLAQALDRFGPRGTPAQIHQAVKQELQRIRQQLSFAPPEPQLETSAERLNVALLSFNSKPAMLNSNSGRPDSNTARRSWLTLEPLRGQQAKLLDGVALNARPGSRWGIYGASETRFAPGQAIAMGTVEKISGRDAILSLDVDSKMLPHQARAIAVAPPDVSRDLPILISGGDKKQMRKLGKLLQAELPHVRAVKPGDFARLQLNFDGRGWVLHDASGLQTVATFRAMPAESLAQQLVPSLVRLTNVLGLLALENPTSDIDLTVGVRTETSSLTSERGLVKVTDTPRLRYRIRQNGEARSHANSLMVEVVADRPVYLTIVDVDTEGAITLLFPNSYQRHDFHTDGFIPANEIVRIPDQLASGNRAGFHWDYGPPVGRDTLRVFAATDLETARLIRSFIARAASDGTSLAQLGDQLAAINTRGVRVVADTAPASSSGSSTASAADLADRQDAWTARSLVLDITE
ncbi:caspase family protein [Pseudomaricurvus sp. HS19]|uniref:caspase family protein n=1 Tax=Pseudomaricurvus sp. HS19 TaxID=2692626 RepID=UPI0013699EFB|nr:caspase family protein [Pseudomaricurvus sp. HS19]MYM62681.1 DUF4384 domain-containing protein [Pseudomaricurvus sp. HS19]